MALAPLTQNQKDKINRLQPALKKAALNGDLQKAKTIIHDLKDLLTNTGRSTKLMELKCFLFEAYMESGDVNFATNGFIGIRAKTNKNTRTFLEATSLLAICYLRNKDIDKAEPLIKEVLTNDKVIKSESKRAIFRKNIIERFDEEATLFAMQGNGHDELNPEEIQNEAGKILSQHNEDEIFQKLGEAVPNAALGILFRIDDFSKKQLPSAERKRLPSPREALDSEKVGHTLFSSVKRTVYKSLCNPESEVYRAWHDKGLKLVLNKFYLGSIVTTALFKLGIGIKAFAIYITALIIRFGIDVYCEHYKPEAIMDLR